MITIPSRAKDSRLPQLAVAALLVAAAVVSVFFAVLFNAFSSGAIWVNVELHSSIEVANSLTALALSVVLLLPGDRYKGTSVANDQPRHVHRQSNYFQSSGRVAVSDR